VQLQIDGTVVASDQFSPYDLVAPPAIALGMHELEVVARDRAGNEAAAIIHVTIGAGCASDADCDNGAICAGGACVGDLGSPCDVHGDCASGECNIGPDGERACTEGCGGGDSCPGGFSCVSATQGAPAKCWPAEGDGGPCAAAPGRRGAQGASLLVMLGLALLARRRRDAR
jgi:hypothetical protein